MSKLSEYWEAYRKYKSEDVNVKLHVEIDWFGIALGTIIVMWAYKELFL